MNVSGEAAQSTTGGALTDLLSNGSYTFEISTQDKNYQAPGGSFVINGTAFSLAVTFQLVTYGVSFTESGLPSPASWWSNVTGEPTQGSTNATITCLLSNGSYTFDISTADKTYQAPGGSFAVDGAAVSLAVTFQLVVYDVTFTEAGLPSGTGWSVTLAGGSQPATAPGSIVFTQPNGTGDAYIVDSPLGFTAGPSTGTVNVTGAPVTVLIRFSPTNGTGAHPPPTPSITSFTVSPSSIVNGSTATLTLLVSGGDTPLAFEYTGLPPGCATSNSSTITCTPITTGSWEVRAVVTDALGREASANASLTVTAAPEIPGTSAPKSNGTTLFGLPAIEGYAIIAGIAGLVAVAFLARWLVRRRDSSDVPIETPGENEPPPPSEEETMGAKPLAMEARSSGDP